MASYDSAKARIQAILDSGRSPQIQWTFVDDPAKTVDRMVYRAAGQNGHPGIGRAVSLDYMAHAYDQVPRNLERLKREFGDQIDINVIDNSGSKDSEKWYPESDLGRFTAQAKAWKGRTQEAMRGEYEKLRAQGAVPENIHQAVMEPFGDRGVSAPGGGGRTENSGEHEESAQGLPRPVLETGSQPVGSTEPESGRVVTQPTDKLAPAQKLASAAAPELESKLGAIAKDIPGAKMAGVRKVKNPARAREKALQEGQPVETISDLLAARMTADSPAAHDRLVAAIKSRFPVIKEENNFTQGDPQYGYRSHSLQVRMGNGSTAEVQIVPREVQAIQSQTHSNYKAGRTAEIAGRTEAAEGFKAANRTLNDSAMGRFQARNGLMTKGDRVRLQDGTLGTVAYADPKMRIVRVRTEDGRNLMARNENVEVLPNGNGNGGGNTAVTKRSDERQGGQANGVQDERGGSAVTAGQEPVGAQGGSGREGVGGDAATATTAGTNGGEAVATVPTDSLAFDPKRFQYKQSAGPEGATDLLKGKPWDNSLAGVLSVWRDPADGKTYVVNGHHRFLLATERGVPDLDVKYIHAPDAVTARAAGAAQNIAEGRGTALDAAKYFRDSGLRQDEIDKSGISLKEAKARDGLALSQLTDHIFDDVASGRMTEARGVAIGRAAPEPEQQEAIMKMIARAEERGKSVTNETIEELGRLVRNAPTASTTVQTLFGNQEQTRNLGLETAEISSFVRGKIAQERKLFAHVADKGRAEALDKAGNQIATSKNARVAERARQDEELYNRFAGRSGPVDDILHAAAEKLGEKGADGGAIKREAYGAIRKALSNLIPSAEERGAEGSEAPHGSTGAGAERGAGGEHGSGGERGGTSQPLGAGRLRLKEAAESEELAGVAQARSPLDKSLDALDKHISRMRSQAENLARFKFKVIRGEGNRGPAIQLSHDAMSLIEKTFRGMGATEALHVPKDTITQFESVFRKLGLNEFADAIRGNPSRSGGVVLALEGVEDSVLGEEHHHDWQDFSKDFHQAGVERARADNPEAFQRAFDAVRKLGYDRPQDTPEMVDKEIFCQNKRGPAVRYTGCR